MYSDLEAAITFKTKHAKTMGPVQIIVNKNIIK